MQAVINNANFTRQPCNKQDSVLRGGHYHVITPIRVIQELSTVHQAPTSYIGSYFMIMPALQINIPCISALAWLHWHSPSTRYSCSINIANINITINTTPGYSWEILDSAQSESLNHDSILQACCLYKHQCLKMGQLFYSASMDHEV